MRPHGMNVAMGLAALGACHAPNGSESASGDRPVAWGGLAAGNYDVGFEVARHTDSAAIISPSDTVSFPVATWYPADGTGTAIRHADYLGLNLWDQIGDEPTESDVNAYRRAWFDTRSARGMDSAQIDRLWNLETAARRGAPRADGPFPLVVLAPGYRGPLVEQFILAEYLASHGFIVTSMPHVARFGATGNSAGIQTALLDMLVAGGRRRPETGAGLALVGYSLCGACILEYQYGRGGADVLVSLDGWEGWRTGADYVESRISVHAIEAPYLYLAEDPRIVKEYEDPANWDHRVARTLAAREGGALIYFRDLRHVDFTSTGLLEFQAPGYSFNEWQKGVRVSDAAAAAEVHRYALRFLRTHLRPERDGRAKFCAGPESDGIAAGSIVMAVSGLCGVHVSGEPFR